MGVEGLLGAGETVKIPALKEQFCVQWGMDMQAVLSKVHGRCKGRKNTQPTVRPRAEVFNPVLGQGTSWRRPHCVATKRGVDERGLGERKGIGLEVRSGRR